jgi:hypothetical protein
MNGMMNKKHFFGLRDCFKNIVAVLGHEWNGRDCFILNKIRERFEPRIIALCEIYHLEII